MNGCYLRAFIIIEVILFVFYGLIRSFLFAHRIVIFAFFIIILVFRNISLTFSALSIALVMIFIIVGGNCYLFFILTIILFFIFAIIVFISICRLSLFVAYHF